ncbi:MAG: hypothetical protein SWY16_25355 [Cyanobacteriota bacterium]|nr:hypothetical protein [Cyanobacteriota bacterium]
MKRRTVSWLLVLTIYLGIQILTISSESARSMELQNRDYVLAASWQPGLG